MSDNNKEIKKTTKEEDESADDSEPDNVSARECRATGSQLPSQSILRPSCSYKAHGLEEHVSVKLIVPNDGEGQDATSCSEADTQSLEERRKRRQKFNQMRREHYAHMYCDTHGPPTVLGERLGSSHQHNESDGDNSDTENASKESRKALDKQKENNTKE